MGVHDPLIGRGHNDLTYEPLEIEILDPKSKEVKRTNNPEDAKSIELTETYVEKEIKKRFAAAGRNGARERTHWR